MISIGWQICGFCVFATFAIAAFAMLFVSLGANAFAPIRTLLRQASLSAKILAGVGLLFAGYIGGTKPAGLAERGLMGSLLGRLGSAPIADLEIASGGGILDYFPSSTNAVTNLTCVGMMKTTSSIVFGVCWPYDALSATNGLDLFALDDLARNKETNAWQWVGHAAVAEGAGRAVFELTEDDLPVAFGDRMFFMFGFAVDGDGDGLSDSFERIVSRTNPENADTDGDGMDDGWEYGMGLDPFDDDAADDTDGDGISNVDEYRLGTCPMAKDTDGDGLDDLVEVGGANEVFTTDGLLVGGVILTNLTGDAAFTATGRVDCVEYVFDEPIEMGGSSYARVSLDPNGIIYLRPAGSTNAISSCSFPDDYAKVLSHVCDYVLMPYWSRLNVQAVGMNASEVTVGLVDGCYVVTYKNMRFDPAGMTDLVDPSLRFLIPLAVSMTPVSFQAVINPSNSTIEYRYQINGIAAGGLDTRDYAKGRLAAIGARGLFGNTVLNCGFGNPDAISSGTGIRFASAAGTDPASADTDGDGMNDGEELKNGRNPKDETDGNAPKDGTIHLCFGDPSNTHSESYRVKITAVDGSGEGTRPADREYVSEVGKMFDSSITLEKGWKYEVRMYWESTNLDTPDYDYVIGFGSANPWVVIDDPDNLRDCHVYEMLTTDFPAAGKVATICVCDFDFAVKSEKFRSYDECDKGFLIDNRFANIAVTVIPAAVDVSRLDLTFTSCPVEEGVAINDNKGTGIVFNRIAELHWRTSKIYWYGIEEPDRECCTCHWKYRFNLKSGDKIVCAKEYPVFFPETDAGAKWFPLCATETKITPIARYTATDHPFYYCYIQPGDFDRSWDGDIVSFPHLEDQHFSWSGQYEAQILEEERFHMQQLKGEVGLDQGGAVECFTTNGIAYFIRKASERVKYISGEMLMISGETEDEVRERARRVIDRAVRQEHKQSRRLIKENRYYLEYKAKQHVNYNAAYRWECTYGKKCHEVPTYKHHPYADQSQR